VITPIATIPRATILALSFSSLIALERWTGLVLSIPAKVLALFDAGLDVGEQYLATPQDSS
jgi:hypothetical protein